ncbi:GLUG motif-containing protein [Natronobiforma cellulositropha]|uniref:GLUG motif-containing protein n=1 Tax=Natronobiforma cellulositropha TaxID=1679076 RepID=UPI0021D5C584|nr:GLUG motif-containing protein [Natronobiforma cellulositropha]
MTRYVRVLVAAAALLVVAGSAWGLGVADEVVPAETVDGLEGAGTADDPYVLTSAADVQQIEQDRSAHYELAGDIDASGVAGFEPIGDATAPFTGSFDGNGHTIAGLTIHAENDDHVGLFGVVDGGVVEAVHLADADVRGGAMVGALVGFNAGEVHAASASGTVSGTDDVGGLVGVADGPVTESAALTDVEGSSAVGGLVGFNSCGPVTDTWAGGEVSGDERVGGLVGENHCTVSRSYATGSVDGGVDTGGAIGDHVAGSVTDVYWDRSATGQHSSDAGTGLESSGMTGSNADAALSGFVFGDTWETTDEYPLLVWQDGEADPGADTDTGPSDGIDLNGYTAQDLTGDGLHEDITGDGNVGFNDVVVFFEHLGEPAVTDNVDAFDFSGNGSVGFADVIALFEGL